MLRGALIVIGIGSLGCGGSSESDENQPPASCMRRCVDDNEACSIATAEDFPTLELTRDDWEAKCGAQRPFLSRGACEDGKQVLTYSTGHNGERRVYDAQGEFSSVIEFTDSGSAPCYGQAYWPTFPQCENAIVEETICGADDPNGDSMSLWYEPPDTEP